MNPEGKNIEFLDYHEQAAAESERIVAFLNDPQKREIGNEWIYAYSKDWAENNGFAGAVLSRLQAQGAIEEIISVPETYASKISLTRKTPIYPVITQHQLNKIAREIEEMNQGLVADGLEEEPLGIAFDSFQKQDLPSKGFFFDEGQHLISFIEHKEYFDLKDSDQDELNDVFFNDEDCQHIGKTHGGVAGISRDKNGYVVFTDFDFYYHPQNSKAQDYKSVTRDFLDRVPLMRDAINVNVYDNMSLGKQYSFVPINGEYKFFKK